MANVNSSRYFARAILRVTTTLSLVGPNGMMVLVNNDQ